MAAMSKFICKALESCVRSVLGWRAPLPDSKCVHVIWYYGVMPLTIENVCLFFELIINVSHMHNLAKMDRTNETTKKKDDERVEGESNDI